MKIDVTTRALIPTRLVAEAARESSRRALGRIQAHARTSGSRSRTGGSRPGVVCCQVEIDVAEGTAVIARSVNANPVEAVSEAFDKAARSHLPGDWTESGRDGVPPSTGRGRAAKPVRHKPTVIFTKVEHDEQG